MGHTPNEHELEVEQTLSEQSGDGEKRASAAEPCVQDAKLALPEGHRVPEGATLLEGEDDGFCRVLKLDGSRCRAARIRGTPLCAGHTGIGVGRDPQGNAVLAREAKARVRARRELLGIGPARVAQPRQIARLKAQERAEEIAAALVIAPLEDPSLGTLERQRAVVTMLAETYPLATASVEVEVPAAGEVGSLGWADMQALAARLLDA
ncbi:MAG TPA: hypothetical protein VLI07_18790 [Candidatus Binatus sp.]|nr:hypothetical protein [Candidatus Binatus sp.]